MRSATDRSRSLPRIRFRCCQICCFVISISAGQRTHRMIWLNFGHSIRTRDPSWRIPALHYTSIKITQRAFRRCFGRCYTHKFLWRTILLAGDQSTSCDAGSGFAHPFLPSSYRKSCYVMDESKFFSAYIFIFAPVSCPTNWGIGRRS